MTTSRRFRLYPGAVIPSSYDNDIKSLINGRLGALMFGLFPLGRYMTNLPQDDDIVQPEPSEFKLRVSSELLTKVPMSWDKIQAWLEVHMWDVRLKAHMDLFYTDIFFKTRELYLEFVDKFPGFLQGS